MSGRKSVLKNTTSENVTFRLTGIELLQKILKNFLAKRLNGKLAEYIWNIINEYGLTCIGYIYIYIKLKIY